MIFLLFILTGMILYCSLYKTDKEGMRGGNSTSVFRMELNTDKPWVINQFDDFNQIIPCVYARRYHS